MLPDVFNAPRLLDVYWTLAIEMIFYIGAVLLYSAFGQMRLRTAFLTAAALYLMVALISLVQIAGGKGILADRLFLLAVMFTGTTARVIEPENRARGLGFLLLCFFATINLRAYIFFVLQLYPGNDFFNFTNCVISHAIAAAIFFAGIYSSWTARPLIFVGRISYSIYILHPLAILLFDWMGWSHPMMSMGIYIPVVCLIVIAVSTFTYSFVEEPAIRMGKRVSKYYDGTSFAAGEASNPTS
jgi:peptidoglycan/LPS O-acetylase OafA/YrhL